MSSEGRTALLDLDLDFPLYAASTAPSSSIALGQVMGWPVPYKGPHAALRDFTHPPRSFPYSIIPVVDQLYAFYKA